VIELQTLVIGVGNDWRGDDGAGPAVVGRLGCCPLVTVLRHGGDGADLIEVWQDAARVILIDAVRSGAAPGTVHRVDAGAVDLPAHWRFCSSHHIGVAEAIALARVLGRLPRHLVIYGIEGENFALGTGLSPAVARAVETVAGEIRQFLDSKNPFIFN